MKKFLTKAAVALLMGTALAFPSVATSPTTVGMRAGDFFKSSQTELCGASVKAKPSPVSVPGSSATPSVVKNQAPVILAPAADNQTVYGICCLDNKSFISSLKVSSTPEVKNEADVTMGGQMTWQTGAFDGAYYFIVGNMSFADQYIKYAKGSGWQQHGNNMIYPAVNMAALTYDKSDKTFYGILTDNADFSKGKKFEFCTFAFEPSSKKTVISTMSKSFAAIACDKTGKIYAMATDGSLYTIDKATGDEKLVGSTGVNMGASRNSMCFNKTGDAILWHAAGALYTVNPTTAEATKIADVPGVWTGIFIEADDTAVTPSWITNLKIEYENGSLDGNILFNMPTTDANGGTLSGKLVYHIKIDETEKASGEAETDSPVKVPLSLTEGTHKFEVYASKDGKDGYISQQTKFIGHDTPNSPGGITVNEKDNIVTVSWNPVLEGVHGGYIDAAAITYTLVREPGNVIIADKTNSTLVVDDKLVSLGEYTYKVSASDGVKTSDPSVSETKLLGQAYGIVPPYEYLFGEKGMGLFTEINANNDNYKWGYDSDAKVVWLPSNPSADSDDWLISPQISLDSDCYYSFLTVLQGSMYLEKQRIEIRMGKTPTPEGMTKVLLNPTEFDYIHAVKGLIRPDESGKFYIGIHVTTPAVTGAIGISQFSIGAPVHKDAPAQVANYKFKAGPNGSMTAEISFDAPKYTFTGAPLSAINQIAVKNSTTGETIKTFENPTPGAALTATDNHPAAGNNSYVISVSNVNGPGPEAYVSGWVGPDLPSNPTAVRWKQNGKKAQLSWTAPTEGANKGYFDASKVTYRIYDYDQILLADNVTSTSYELEPVLEEGMVQTALFYYVTAVNNVGESAAKKSNTTAFGTGYLCPFGESFEKASTHSYPWIIECVENTNYFMPATDIIGFDVRSYDDDGMLVYAAFNKGVTRFCFPILDFSNLKTPALKFHVYYMDNNTRFNVVASDDSGQTWYEVGSVAPNTLLNRWHMATIDLSPLAGKKEVRIALNAVSDATGLYACLDRFRIANLATTDMTLADLSLPAKVYAGKDFDLSISAINNGSKKIPSYTVDFIINGKVEESVECPAIEPSQYYEIPLTLTLSPNAKEFNFEAKVICEGDQVPGNNSITGKAVTIRSPYPAPTNLANTSDAKNKVDLVWTAPAETYLSEITDDLENYEPGSVGGIDIKATTSGIDVKSNRGKIGKYTLIDNDKLLTTYVYGVSPSLIPNLGQGMVCQVIDMDQIAVESNLWSAHSGKRIFCFWQAMTHDGNPDVANDDYLILPELDTNSNILSFWAKTLTDKYELAKFEIMTSSTGMEISDFTLLQEVTKVPAGYATAPENGYTHYEFTLPEGTKYAAIHYTGRNSSAMFLDDITFTPTDALKEVTLKGYNVYRNGKKINSKSVTEAKYTDIPASNDHYVYNVTAVFEEGESPYSNDVDVYYSSGIDDITDNGSGRIYVEGRNIVAEGFAGQEVNVYTPAGVKVSSVIAPEKAYIPVASGLYIVKAGKKGITLAVK